MHDQWHGWAQDNWAAERLQEPSRNSHVWKPVFAWFQHVATLPSPPVGFWILIRLIRREASAWFEVKCPTGLGPIENKITKISWQTFLVHHQKQMFFYCKTMQTIFGVGRVNEGEVNTRWQVWEEVLEHQTRKSQVAFDNIQAKLLVCIERFSTSLRRKPYVQIAVINCILSYAQGRP